ncbi:MAG: sugar transferase [Beijerinckiaceae bacterium]
MYEQFGKRTLDIVLSLAAIAVLSPVIALTAAVIILSDGWPALFRQLRVGRNGAPFTIYKFRTYPIGTPDLPSADAATLTPTRLGRFLRRTNLDEIPQLFNILVGDMSLVGPRPGLPSQVTQARIRRENGAVRLRPGLTGLAQIRGRDAMPESEKAMHDGEYAANVSLAADLSILFRTARFILGRPPVY